MKMREVPTGNICTEVNPADLTKNELLAVVESVNEYSTLHIFRYADGVLCAVTSGQSWELDYEEADDDDNEGEA